MKQLEAILPVAAGILVSFIFGFSFLFSKEALLLMTPFELLAHRFTVAVILMLLLILIQAVKIRFNFQMFQDILGLACLQPVLYFIGETFGVKLTSASESGLIIALIPVAVTLIAGFILKENTSWQQWLLIFCSIAGVVVTVLAGTGLEFGAHFLGIGALLAAVIAAGFYNVLSRRLASRYSPIEITLVMMIIGAIFFNFIRLLTLEKGEPYFRAFNNPHALIGILYLGLLSSVAAFFLLNFMLSKMTASRVAIFVNLTTIVSVVAGVGFRGETFGILHLIGGSLILIGVWGANVIGLK